MSNKNSAIYQIDVNDGVPVIQSITISVGAQVRWTCESEDFRVLFSSAKCPFSGNVHAGFKGSVCISSEAKYESEGTYSYTILVFTPEGIRSTNAQLTVT